MPTTVQHAQELSAFISDTMGFNRPCPARPGQARPRLRLRLSLPSTCASRPDGDVVPSSTAQIPAAAICRTAHKQRVGARIRSPLCRRPPNHNSRTRAQRAVWRAVACRYCGTLCPHWRASLRCGDLPKAREYSHLPWPPRRNERWDPVKQRVVGAVLGRGPTWSAVRCCNMLYRVGTRRALDARGPPTVPRQCE